LYNINGMVINRHYGLNQHSLYPHLLNNESFFEVFFKKMKLCGIIAEYNPFHNGHKMQLDSAMEKTGADFCVVVMSGMFTQRGDIAIASKFLRAQTAVSQGADIVIELPVCYALQPAEYFALGGVGILNGLGVNYISYGTEAVSESDRKTIDKFVKLTNKPSKSFEKGIKLNLKKGLSYPQSRIEAFSETSDIADVSVLKSPNAILEIAYRNAIHRLRSKIIPVPVPRVGDAYHEMIPQSKIASATAIRKLIRENKNYSSFVPYECDIILKKYFAQNTIPDINMFYPYLVHTAAASPEKLQCISDGNQELYNRMINAIAASSSFEEFVDNASTRRFTSARVSRALMHSILNIPDIFISQVRSHLPLYARVLAVKKESKEILSVLANQSRIPFFTSVAKNALKTNLQKEMLSYDIAASNLYNLTVAGSSLYNQDYTQKLTIC